MVEGIEKLNIRVYGIFKNEEGDILVSDEFRMGTRMTKFPGGGLIPGEGTIDCLKREALEEFGQAVEILEHFYTTDFFQKALFFNDQQLISIYYKARFVEKPGFKISKEPFDIENREGAQSFRWVPLQQLRKSIMTFPIDQKVAGMLARQPD